MTRADPGAIKPSATPPRWQLLLQHIRPHRLVLVGATLLGLFATASELISPLITRTVLERLENAESLRGPVLVLLTVLVVSNLLGYVQAVVLGTVAERVIRGARRQMLSRVLHRRLDQGEDRTGGEMVSRVTSDTTLIREAATSSLVYLVNGTVTLLGTLALMAYLDLVLLGVSLGVLTVAAVLTMALMPRLARVQQQVQEQLGRLGATLDGLVKALRTVKASRAEERELAGLGERVEDASRLGVRAVRLEAAAWTLTEAAVNLVVLVVLGLGAWRVSTGALDVPSLVAFLLYVFGLLSPVMMLTMSITSLQSGLAAAARIEEVVSLPQEQDEPGARGLAHRDSVVARGEDAAGPVLRLDDVRVRYGPSGPPALDGVSLEVARCGHTAIVGPSGAGKTTVFSLLLKFLHAESGRVQLDERDYRQWTTDAVRARIGYVEQDSPVVPGSVRHNVTHAVPEADDVDIWAALSQVRLDGRIRSLPEGIDSEVTATTLSGGERQRIGIARALLTRPEVLLMDEATAQLDALTEQAVAAGVAELASRGAVVTIAHRLSTVVHADRIIVMESGRVRAVGTHRELLGRDELYRDLVTALRVDPPGL